MSPVTEQPGPAAPSHRSLWDRLGIAGSLLCVVHCAATPLLLGVLSAAGLGFLGDEIFHKVLAVFLVIVAALAFYPGFRTHRNLFVLSLGIFGGALILGTGFFLEPLLSHSMEIGLTLTGSFLLIGAHAFNWRLSHTHSVACCPSH